MLGAFHIMTKPVGAACNLACRYCFYLEKSALYPKKEASRMKPEVLREYIRQYIESQPTPEVVFAWQGGEPTLYGLDGFRQIVAWQEELAGGKTIRNSLQTNGTLINKEWAGFLRKHQFLVGISIDGPADLHDTFRVDRRGGTTFAEVLRGLKLLRKHQVEFNTLTVVNRRNARHPDRIYDFLDKIGSRFWQFIPVVERMPTDGASCQGPGPTLSPAPSPGQPSDEGTKVTPWSVNPRDYGDFMCRIFDRWVAKDVGRIFVQAFDTAFAQWLGQPSPLCVHAKECGNAMAMEYNGDVYACDHYVYPDHRLGNLMETPLPELAEDPRQIAFGQAKASTLPEKCRQCPWLFACAGGCPKQRFVPPKKGTHPDNYLCEGYFRFFEHIDPAMRTMAKLYQRGLPPAQIMKTGIL
ncbi:MAG: anaerobic sulfatase maturase [Opitutales bacterium]|nr:anaerobic sulfatase maturase [Opitutales bacterium]